jgi:hypothetical protein
MANRYWVGNGGDWLSTSHWSTSSNGSSGASVPTSADDVFFDQYSITSSGQTISGSNSMNCKNITVSGVLNNPTFEITMSLSMYGTMSLQGTGVTYTGNQLAIKGAACTINTNGASVAWYIYQNTVSTSTTLNGNFTTTNANGVQVYQGTFSLNNYNLTTGMFWSASTSTRTVTLGNGALEVTGSYGVDFSVTTGLTLTAHTCLIRLKGTDSLLYGGNLTFAGIEIDAVTTTISGSNNLGAITLTKNGNQTVKFTAGTTQTINSGFYISYASSSSVKTLQSTIIGLPFTLSDSAGTTTFDYCSISDCTGAGGATWNATNSTNVLSKGKIALTKASTHYGTIPAAVGNLTSSGNSFEVEFSFKPDSQGQSIMCKRDITYTAGTDPFGWVIQAQGASALIVYSYSSNGGGLNYIQYGSNLTSGTVYYGKLTYDGTTVRLYQSTDGVNWGTAVTSTNAGLKTALGINNTSLVQIGRDYRGSAGYIDYWNSDIYYIKITKNSVLSHYYVFANAGTNQTITDGVNAQNGSSYNGATQSLVSSGNTNINFNQRYWVGGSGNWSSTAHWSTTSGGASGASVPTSTTEVYFNANSFTSGSATVTVDASAFCKSMNWTGATNSPVLAGTQTIDVYGDITFVSGMTITHNQSIYLKGSGNITTAGVTVGSNFFTTTGCGTYTLQDNLTFNSSTGGFYHTVGTFNINGKTVTSPNMYCSGSGIVLTLGAATLNISGGWTVDSAVTLTSNTASIVMTGTTFTFSGGGKTYYNLESQVTTLTITGSNTFNQLKGTAGKTISITAGTTQTISSMVMTGVAGSLITLQSTSAGTPYTLSDTTGINVFTYCSIKDCTATGGATWSGKRSTNVSGNTGITFYTSRFWIGGTGNWTDTAHWSTSSGGTGGASVPTSTVDAYIDSSSGGGTITINSTANTLDLDFTGFTGTFTSSYVDVNVYGNLTMGSGMTNTHTGSFVFKSSGTQTVRSNGIAMLEIKIQATDTPTIQLLDKLTVTKLTNYHASANRLDANGQTVEMVGLYSDITGNFTFYNLTKNSADEYYSTLRLMTGTSSITVTGTLTLNGFNAKKRLMVGMDYLNQSHIQVTISAATVVASYVDFRDINATGAASWNLSAITGGSGDCTGNSGITFTTPTTQTWSGTTGGNWEDNAWTTRIPLPQDTANMGIAWTAGQTISHYSSQRISGVNWTGATGNPTWAITASAGLGLTCYGNITLIAGMTISHNATAYLTLCNTTLNTAAQSINGYIDIDGNVTLASALSCNTIITHYYGTFATANYNVTCSRWVGSSSRGARILNMGSSTFTLTGTSTCWTVLSGTYAYTVNCGTSTIKLTNSSSSSKTFSGDGRTYYNIWNATGSTGTVTIQGSNTFNELKSDAGRTNRFTSGTTQTISSMVMTGSAGSLITLQSVTAGSAFTLSDTTGTNAFSYCSIKDCTATGGATWNATDGTSTNVSGNTGINWPAIPDRFWIGGTGNWSDTAHWSTTSNGSGGASVPTSTENAYFDASSGTGTVTVDTTANCKDLICTGYTGTLTGGSALNVYGSMTLVAGMTMTHASSINMKATSTGKTVTTAGKSLYAIDFDGVGGGWTLSDSLTVTNDLSLTNGSFNTGNQAVSFRHLGNNNSNVRTLTLGSSTITVTGDWYCTTTTNLTFAANTSTIIMSGNTKTFSGGGLTYNNLQCTGTPITIQGSNTFTQLKVSSSKTVQLIAGTTQVIADVDLGDSVAFNCTTSAAAYITYNGVSYTACGTGLSRSWVSVSTPNAPANKRYWVGGTGNYSDSNHWATLSGFFSGASVPSTLDDVYFDSKSFTAGSQVVTVDALSYSNSMDWTGVTNTPTFAGSSQIFVKSNFTLASAMNYTHSTAIYLNGTGNITTNGVTITSYFYQWSGEVSHTLQDNLTLTGTAIYLVKGTFDTNGKTVTVSSINGTTGTAVCALTLGASTVTITGAFSVSNANCTINAGTSTIIMSGATKTFAGGDRTYYNLECTGTPIIIQGSNTFNQLKGTAGKTINFTAGTTQTVTNILMDGASGNLITLQSVTAGTPFTLSDTTGINKFRYCSIQDCTGAGGATWNAYGSTNVSGNTNINFLVGRFWVGGTGNWNDTAHWSTVSNGATGASIPTSADNVYFDDSSTGIATVNATANTLDLDFTGFTGELTSTNVLNVYGNLVMGAGMTWSHTGALTFKATSGTKTITSNGISAASTVVFNGVGGTFQLADNWTCTNSSNNRNWTLTNGTFDPNGKTVSLNSRSNVTITGDFTFYNLTRTTSDASLFTESFSLSGNITVSNNLSINGYSATHRLHILSFTVGTARTITVNGTLTATNVDLQDITGAGSANWNLSAITGLSGDCGGNSGITFTTPTTQTCSAGLTWSACTWTSRVPLPQDTANFSGSSRTITQDMPRIGSVDFTGSSGITWTTNTACNVYGSIDLTNLTALTASTQQYTFMGRASHTLKSAGNTWSKPIQILCPNGTLTLQDDLPMLVAGAGMYMNLGTFDANDFNVSLGGAFTSSHTNVRTLNMGSGTWTLAGTGQVWNSATNTNFTLNSETSTIKITNNSSTYKILDLGGLTYYNIWNATLGTGAFTITGSNTFNQIKTDSGRTTTLTASTTTKISAIDMVGATLQSTSTTDAILDLQEILMLTDLDGITLTDITVINDLVIPIPNITIISHTRDKISDETGLTTSTVTFQTDVPILEWEARADGSGHGTGLIVGSGSSHAENSDIQFAVDYNELTSGDKSYKINIYARTMSGWTEYEV